MVTKYWKLWMERLEEAEDQSVQPLTDKALTNYRFLVSFTCYNQTFSRNKVRENILNIWALSFTLQGFCLEALFSPLEGKMC